MRSKFAVACDLSHLRKDPSPLAQVNYYYLFILFLVENAAEFFAAGGAEEVFGIKLLIEADGFAAGGANDLEKVVIVAEFAVAVIAIAVAEVIVLVEVILVKLNLFIEEILYCLEVIVKLLDILVEVVEILVDLVNVVLNVGESGSHFVHKLEECGKDLALLGGLVKLETFCKSLDIGGFFGEIHSMIPSFQFLKMGNFV